MKHTQNKFSPMQTLRRAVRNRREHGMALLFTLCILSMALITAMIFSSNASTDRKVASAYIDTSAARILADGTVSRAVLALMSSNASYACSNYLKDPPTNGSGNTADEYASDWIWKIEKPGMFSFNEGPLRYSNKYYDRQDTRCPSWEYVYYHAPDGTDRIYGRYAYVAIGQNDQLNPNAIGKRNGSVQPGYDDSIRQKRLGRWTCEPEFIFMDKNNLWGENGNIVTPQKISNARPTAGWNDMDVFFTDVASSADKHLRMMVDQYFTVSGEEEYNKFNTRGDLIKNFTVAPSGSNEQFRFPLIRNDWNSITVDQVKSAIPYFRDSRSSEVNQTIANLINYNANFNRAPVTDVANWTTGEPSYTGNKCTPYLNEVGGEVEVGGNIGIRMNDRVINENGDWEYYVWYTDCTYSHTFTLRIETANMYGIAARGVSAPIPFGTVSYEYLNPENGHWIPQEFTFDANNTKWDTTFTDSGSAFYHVYGYIIDSGPVGSVTTPKRGPYTRPMGHESDFYDYLKVRNVRVKLDRVLLRDSSGQNADLSLMNTQLSSGNGFTVVNGEHVVAGAGDYSKRGYFDTQVNDPRCNLGRNEWSSPQNNEHWSDNFGMCNTTVNYNSNDPTKCDPGEPGDPAGADGAGNGTVSTAYIAHEPMVSLWELGVIHRGRPWQTINLKCAPDGKSAGSVMADYSAGDGHLLDQVSLVRQEDERATVLGMINLNCVADLGSGGSPFVFKSLFTNFPIYGSIQNMRNGSSTGTVRGKAVNSTDSEADRYAEDLVDSVTYAIKNGNQPRRTAIFPGSASSGSHSGRLFPTNGSDAQREEVVCRVVNILKWGRQQTRRATVLVLAQTIQDVGGVTLERNLPNDDSVLMDSGFKPYDAYGGSKWIQPTLYPSAKSIYDAYKSRAVAYKKYDNFYDRITGEAKVVVRLEWDDSANDHQGAWKVTRKEYAE